MTNSPAACCHCTAHNIRPVGLLVDQGGVVTRVDGKGNQVLRGSDLRYVFEKFHNSAEFTTVHTLFVCERCYERSVRTDSLTNNHSLQIWAPLPSDAPDLVRSFWRQD